ncbi:MAG: CBS domain-containing protein [Verrucomicrobia bacterium]|nr:MAG: CBS domain-containing protein [Verrucomicrobiota bacterium]
MTPLPSPRPNLRVLDDANLSRELDLVTELFHRINRIIPENQKLLTIPPEMPAREAIAILRQRGYSQLPVVIGGEVLGVFSFRSFAQKAADASWQELSQEKCAPGDIAVEECLERFEFARVTDEMRQVFDAMDHDGGVLIGSPEQLHGILTPMDFLRYLYKVASPFVMISEIELTLRALIRLAVNQEELTECAQRALAQLYGVEKVPNTLEAMTFDNYKAIISHGLNWSKFEPILGSNRMRITAKLKQLCELRNDLFHFKREFTMQDHETITDHRDWLLLRARQAELRHRTGGQP